jgi:5'-3' exoribonuclease 1
MKPSDAEHRLGGQHFTLGDRIIYAADSGKVPIATKGTVVGLTQTSRETLLDIVFDVSFMSGTTLGDRCSPFRGSTVPTWSVLNLSEGQVRAVSKAGASRQIPEHSSGQSWTAAGYGAPGINGKGHLVDGQAPPALRGGWRGVVAGHPARGGGARGQNGHPSRGWGSDSTFNHQRGGRGGLGFGSPQVASSPSDGPGGGRGMTNGGWRGGGRTRGGYVSVDRGDEPEAGVMENNPQFKPQSHRNVPPPVGLDSPGRGGRGRGSNHRGSGGRGRGGGRG